MQNLKTIIVALFLTLNLNAQVAPTTGKKILEVKETYEGEYLQIVKREKLSKVVLDAIKERVPEKLIKYGFTDISITEVGQVSAPEDWTSKMASITSNKSVGRAMLTTAKTYGEISAAINKMYEPENNEENWKFQANFKDNTSGKEFKIRINLMYSPQYIIKESDLIKGLTNEQKS
jgi:hypothetical protein